MIQKKYLKKLENLSVIARQCIAAICLQRYCQYHGIVHPLIEQFIEQEWKITTATNWDEWVDGFHDVPIYAENVPLPEELAMVIPIQLQEEFKDLVNHVYDTSASTWYAGNYGETYNELVEVLNIIDLYHIPLPDLEVFQKTKGHNREDWGGSKLTQDEINQWKAAA